MLEQPLEIMPYQAQDGEWVFDDGRVGLVEEPLLRGTDRLINVATAAVGIATPGEGFRLQFADCPFDGWQYRVNFMSADEELGGNWYFSPDFGIRHWLCPALFLYYPQAPAVLYVALAERT